MVCGRPGSARWSCRCGACGQLLRACALVTRARAFVAEDTAPAFNAKVGAQWVRPLRPAGTGGMGERGKLGKKSCSLCTTILRLVVHCCEHFCARLRQPSSETGTACYNAVATVGPGCQQYGVVHTFAAAIISCITAADSSLFFNTGWVYCLVTPTCSFAAPGELTKLRRCPSIKGGVSLDQQAMARVLAWRPVLQPCQPTTPV